MFLEWWMIGALAVWWFVSLWDIRRTVFDEGVATAVQGLVDNGYIEIDDNDEVIGLCNSHKLRLKKTSETSES